MSELKKRTRRPKLTIEFIRAELKKFGYVLITKTYTGTKQPLKVRCKNGHTSAIVWNNFARGNRCKQCYVEKQITGNETLKKLVLREQFFCVSEAARILCVKDGELRKFITLGLLPGPTRSFGSSKKYYKMEDIKEIKKLIK